jgi:hypothetical protein
MENNIICTRADFARIIGRTRTWVTDKIKRQNHQGTIEFTSVDGKVYRIRLIRASGTKKDLICIVSTQG